VAAFRKPNPRGPLEKLGKQVDTDFGVSGSDFKLRARRHFLFAAIFSTMALRIASQ
jgi:hypothetical protein